MYRLIVKVFTNSFQRVFSFFPSFKKVHLFSIHCTIKMFSKYSSTDNFLSPVPVSDWLIFCCGNSMLYQKKNENDKNTIFLMKNQMPKSISRYKVIVYSKLTPLTHDVTCSKFWRYEEDIGDKKISVEHTLN